MRSAQGKICHAGGILLLALCFLSAAGYSTTSSAAPVETKKKSLDSVRARIESLRRDMSKTEKSKQDVSQQLRATETAIADTNRRLQQLAQERRAVEEKLATLQAQTKRLEQQTSAQQSHLAQLLNRQLMNGDADALSILLAGRDPNFIARDQYFLTQLSRAKADLVQQLRTTVNERQRLTEAVLEQQTQLIDIARREQESRSQLQMRQQQRAAIARALANDPPILAADEPTGNLDSKTSEEVVRFFAELAKEGKTVVMVTHEHNLSKYFTRSIILADGAVVPETTIDMGGGND